MSNQSLPPFSIVLVNYKTLTLTKTCLELLKKHFDAGAIDSAQVDVWVVDNGSQDESTEYLRGLDWIRLIERTPVSGEPGYAAHGRALDLVLEQTSKDYLFLMHTDTFIYDPEVFAYLLNISQQDPKIVAVGCLDQLNRGRIRSAWRISSRFIKHYVRRLKVALGLKTKPPKPYIETHIKSFFALWNIACIKAMGLSFFMSDRIPGYELQDILKPQGYRIHRVSPAKLFRYLDHIEAGTVGLVSGYSANNRRSLRKNHILKQLNRHHESR